MSADDRLRSVLAQLAGGELPSAETTTEAVAAMMSGDASSVLIGAVLAALRAAGETPEQVAGAARAMRACSEQVTSSRAPLVDTCGTGGDGLSTFSISTAAAFVAAGAGVAVAKHGNRAASGKFGGADTLEALGVAIELSPESAGRCLDEVGMTFLFARSMHPAMRFVAPVRSELGVRTIFNLLGPLTNPARPARQVIGAPSAEVSDLVAQALAALGAEHALVVCSEDGMDEISLAGTNRVIEVRAGVTREFALGANDLGLDAAPADSFVAPELADSVRIVRSVLDGAQGPCRDVVVANAAAAIHVAGEAESLVQGVERARAAIDSGAAGRVLADLVRVSQREAQEGTA